ncbi:MAG TPA: putative Ig domain-containing protein [Steroidobacteraceae bacterium]
MQKSSACRAFLAAILVLIAGCLKDEDPEGNKGPEISGTPLTEVTLGRSYRFTPSATDADGDTLTFEITNKPAWAAFDSTLGKLSGKPTAADVGIYEDILIAVSDGETSAQLAPFSIAVNEFSNGSATLSWEPPTVHEDGSPLTTLAGYRVLYGTSMDELTESDELANAGLMRHTIDNLSAATWYFAVVAYTAGGLESRHSSIVRTTIH